MRIDILTVLPELLESPFSASILKRAMDKGLVEVHLHNIRDYATNKYKSVDDYQYGGGAGMVMSCEPIAACPTASLPLKGILTRRICLFQQRKAFRNLLRRSPVRTPTTR
jgi:tRNA (guanine-N1)-methyltransferase